jgi:hypothetical protein
MTADQARQQRNPRLIETIEDAEQTALEAVRKFVNSIDDTFPYLSEDKPRRKAMDSTFDMIERLVNVASGLAKSLVAITETESSEPGRKSAASSKKAVAPAKAARAKKSAKKATKSTKAVKKATKRSTYSTR